MGEKRGYALTESNPFSGRIIEKLGKLPGGDRLSLAYLKMYILQKNNMLETYLFEKSGFYPLAQAINEDEEIVRLLCSYLISTNELKLTDDYKEKSKKENQKRETLINDDDIEEIIKVWNASGADPVIRISKTTDRYKMLICRVREYGKDAVIQAIKNVSSSDFLKGKNDHGWKITFQWFVKPNNFVKVYEGQYNKSNNGHQNNTDKFYMVPKEIREDMERRGVIRDGSINYAKLSDRDSDILRNAGVKI